MGLFWGIVAFFIPGLPQFLHFDVIKCWIIWGLPLTVLLVLGGFGLSNLSIGALLGAGPAFLAALVFSELYNLYTAFGY